LLEPSATHRHDYSPAARAGRSVYALSFWTRILWVLPLCLALWLGVAWAQGGWF
jgi:hypothetical protein